MSLMEIDSIVYIRSSMSIDALIIKRKFTVQRTRTLKVEESIHASFNDYKPDKELLELNNSFAYLNLCDLKTSSKEHSLDNKPKVDEDEISSKN
ncbi:hypothetical protein CR513_22351, partial [Mucuna pruriens]